MSNPQIYLVLAALLLLFGLVGALELEDAQNIEAMRPQLMETQ